MAHPDRDQLSDESLNQMNRRQVVKIAEEIGIPTSGSKDAIRDRIRMLRDTPPGSSQVSISPDTGGHYIANAFALISAEPPL